MIPIVVRPKFAENHFLVIQNVLRHHIQRVIDNGGIWKLPRGLPRYRISGSMVLMNLLNDFIDPLSNSLKELILISPLDIVDYIENVHLHNPNFTNENHADYKILYNIFVNSVYDNSEFNKYDFINAIDLSTCPYCNRNYIYSVNRRKIVKPEIDHFYPKTLYPILAVSYFNLIPSCESCNGLGAKSQNNPRVVGLTNPYLLDPNQFKFTFKIKNISVINPISGKTSIEVKFKDKIQEHCDIFNLEDLYTLHHDHAIELIIKNRVKYSKKYRAYLNSYRGLKFSKNEIDRMILGNYSLENEQHKRPLSKLYQDIGRELGLI